MVRFVRSVGLALLCLVAPVRTVPWAQSSAGESPAIRGGGNRSRGEELDGSWYAAQGLRLHLGARRFGDDGVDDAFGYSRVIGAELTGRLPISGRGASGGFRWEAALFHIDDEGTASSGTVQLDARILELQMGLRYTGQLYDFSEDLQGFIGGGVEVIEVEGRAVSGMQRARIDERDVGGYVHAGLELRLSGSLHVGVDLRQSFFVDVDTQPFDSDLRGQQLSVYLGWLW